MDQSSSFHLPADWYPEAVRRQLELRDRRGRLVPAQNLSGRFDRQPLGWILHVVVGNNSPYNTFRTAQKPNRRFSNWWVSKSGVVEQYAPAYAVSWAQAGGNESYWSVETEGFPNESLTGEQVEALARLHVWLGAADAIARKPGDLGIGTHQMGGSAWGDHPCPGTLRQNQRPLILRRAVALRTNPRTPEGPAMPGPTAQQNATELLDTHMPVADLGDDGKPITLRYLLSRTYQASQRTEAAVTALVHEVAELRDEVARLRAGGAS